MDQNDNTEYIDIQSGGMDLIKSSFSAASALTNRVVQAGLFRNCSGKDINSYLELDRETNPIQQFYEYFVTNSNLLTEDRIEQISNQINRSLEILGLLNDFIHGF